MKFIYPNMVSKVDGILFCDLVNAEIWRTETRNLFKKFLHSFLQLSKNQSKLYYVIFNRYPNFNIQQIPDRQMKSQQYKSHKIQISNFWFLIGWHANLDWFLSTSIFKRGYSLLLIWFAHQMVSRIFGHYKSTNLVIYIHST